MVFQVGVPLPPNVWSDYERGTSFASDFARLLSGGLTHLGGIQRQREQEDLSRQDRLDERATTADQFNRRLSQDDSHFNATLAERRDENDAEYEVDPTTHSITPVARPPMTTVAAIKASGAAMASQGGGAVGYAEFPDYNSWLRQKQATGACPT